MRSLAIRASAGTGKTFELTLQYIARLAIEHDPGVILATTFTRKAAGEMLDRIVGRLAAAAADTPGSSALHRDIATIVHYDACPSGPQGWADLLMLCCRNLHRVSVSTIDSLFARLLVAFMPDLGYPAMPAMTDDKSPEAAEARIAALERALLDLSAEDARSLFSDLYGGMAVRSVISRTEAFMGALYDLAVSTDPSAWGRMPVSPPIPDADLAQAVETLTDIAESTTSTALRKGLTASVEAARARDWARLLSRGASKNVADAVFATDEPRSDEPVTYSRQRIPEEAVDALVVLCRAAAHQLELQLVQRSCALRRVLDDYARYYADELKRRDILPFTELARMLARHTEVCSPAEIAYRMGLSVRHLLLDEFQDTNRAQWQILSSVFLADDPHGSRASVFCVGDAKQAIYGWRGGVAAIFDALDDAVPDILWEHREQSYRSSQVVLDAVNTVFTGLDRCDALEQYPNVLRAWQTRYRPHSAAYPKPGYVTLVEVSDCHEVGPEESDVETPPDGDPGAGHGTDPEEPPAIRRDARCAWAAERIASLNRAHPGRSIGVLVRTNAAADAMALALQAVGVPASIEGPGNLADDPATQLILSAMLLADHPGSLAEAYHVFRSPLRHALGLQDISFAHRCSVSHRIRRDLSTRGYTAVVAELAHAVSPFGGPRTARRLTRLIEATAQYEDRATTRPADFVRWIRAYTVHDLTDVPVRIMTIHQAKGLQFDIVVAPDLSSRIPAANPLAVEERAREADPPHTVLAYPGEQVRKVSPAARRVHHQQCEREIAEALNVLYVLMTRAAHALYLVVPAPIINKDGSPRKRPFSFEAILRATLAVEKASASSTLYEHGDPGWDPENPARSSAQPADGAALSTVDRVVFGREGRRRHWPEASPSELDATARRSLREMLRLDTTAARQGALLHAWYQAIEWLDMPLPDDDELVRLGLAALPYAEEAWLRQRIPEFRRSLEQEAVRSVFQRPGGLRELWRERSFVVRMDDALIRGRIDRLVVVGSPDGPPKIIVTDFKSDSVTAEAVIERAQHYDAQIRSYALAVSRMLRAPLRNITARLLFVVPGVVHDVAIHEVAAATQEGISCPDS
ncbi:MAG: UvrD-helicase domain-containing protein [Chthonomonadales bacterium]|nr:UvrD-helicase domain-containing protein [Chthonomonadales bacterium]